MRPIAQARSLLGAFVLLMSLAPRFAVGQAKVTDVVLVDAPSAVLESEGSGQQGSSSGAPGQDAAPQEETDEQRRKRLQQESTDEIQTQEKQRIAGLVPEFNVVLGGKAAPISPAQKFSLVLHTSIDPFTIGLAAVLGGYDEIAGTHNGYGWGPAGYFKRFGAQYADNVDGALWGNAILPSILHQDPRYFRMGTGPIPRRILHAALSTLICRGDNGHNQFSISNIAGNVIAGGISNLYYPAEERGIGLAFDNAIQVTAEGAVGAQLLEFSPDLMALWHRHRLRVQGKKAAAGAKI